MSTPLAPGSSAWSRVITASKVPAILGLSSWTSAAEVWLTMRGEVERDTSTSDVQQRGHDLEPRALRLFWEDRRNRDGYIQQTGEVTLHRDDLGFPAAASPDSTGLDSEGRRILCEAKMVGNFDAAKRWGEPGTDEVPVDYYVQTMWQLHMDQLHESPAHTCYISRLGPVLDDHAVYRVDYDPSIAAAMTQKVSEFYRSLDDSDACPRADGRASTVRVFAKRNPDIDADERWQVPLDLARNFVDHASLVMHHEAGLNEAKGELLRLMGKARIAYTVLPDGTEVDVARRQRSGRGIALRNLHPDLLVHRENEKAA